MKRAAAIVLLFILSNSAVAHTFASGGGSESSSDESDLTVIILGVIVAGVATIIVSDILSDNGEDSQDVISGSEQEAVNEETGVEWGNLSGGEEQALPLLAISVFPGENGRNLAGYFSSLITRGNDIYYETYPSPVSFGDIEPAQAAETGFSFLGCRWFVAVNDSTLELYTKGTVQPAWMVSIVQWDSTAVLEASSGFMEFAETLTN